MDAETPNLEVTPSPRGVSRFEANLVALARFLVGRASPDVARKALYEKFTPPPCLSANAVHLVKDTLAKGLVLYLVRAGGWREDRFLRAGVPLRGRAWDRLPLAERRLTLSRYPLDFLMWLTAEKANEPKQPVPEPLEPLTPADELFFMLAAEALRAEVALFESLRTKAAFFKNPLCWLARPADFAQGNEPAPPDFQSCMTGQRAAMLECLQPALAAKWLRTEWAKSKITDWKQMRAEGTAEHAVLVMFLAAADIAGRRDLGGFVLVALSRLLAGRDVATSFWLHGLAKPMPARVSERVATQLAALALPRAGRTLELWEQRARTVAYFDDDYAGSQMAKEDYDRLAGAEVTATARRLVESLDPLRVQPAPG